MKKAACAVAFAAALAGCAPSHRHMRPQNPHSAEEHLQLGTIYEMQGHLEQAAEEYRATLRMDGRNDAALLALGDMAFRRGEFSASEKFYRKALKLQPENPRALNNMALVRHKQKRFPEAEAFARAALRRRNPYEAYTWDTLANIYISQYRFREALEAINRAGRLGPPDDAAFMQGLEETKQRLRTAAPALDP